MAEVETSYSTTKYQTLFFWGLVYDEMKFFFDINELYQYWCFTSFCTLKILREGHGYDYQARDVIINEAFVIIMTTCLFCASDHAHSYEACVQYLYVWILSILFVLLFIDFSSLGVRIGSLFY